MAAEVNVNSTGWDEVVAGISIIDVNLQTELTIEQLMWAGNRLLELARQYVPVKTGALRDSLSVILGPESKSVIVGTDIGYGKYVELGTSKMQARPFLIPALFQVLTELKEQFPEKIKEFIET
jgi:HK97 gp10 family phage protein